MHFYKLCSLRMCLILKSLWWELECKKRLNAYAQSTTLCQQPLKGFQNHSYNHTFILQNVINWLTGHLHLSLINFRQLITGIIFIYNFIYLFFIYLFILLFQGRISSILEVPRLGVEFQLQLPAYTTATAMWDLSRVCDLHYSSR